MFTKTGHFQHGFWLVQVKAISTCIPPHLVSGLCTQVSRFPSAQILIRDLKNGRSPYSLREPNLRETTSHNHDGRQAAISVTDRVWDPTIKCQRDALQDYRCNPGRPNNVFSARSHSKHPLARNYERDACLCRFAWISEQK